MEGSLVGLYRASVDRGLYGSRETRSFIEHALRRIEKSIREDKHPVIVRAPPGIGKTAIPITVLLSILVEELPVASVIHVAPTRSLIDDLAFRVRESLARLVTIAGSLVARQHGLSHETSSLLAPYTVTTFDTYLYNFLKLPTDEILKIYRGRYGHYEVPRASILLAFNFFDEAHMVIEEDDKLGSVVITSMAALSAFRAPLVVSTATLSTPLIERLKAIIQNIDVVDYSDFLKARGEDEFYKVEFNKSFKPIAGRSLALVDDPCDLHSCKLKEYIDKIVEVVESGGRASIVVNTVKLAKCLYSKLRDRVETVLIHSRFTPKDREAKMEAVRRSHGILLVSTQVLEVGVDVSFDAILSQVAPPSSMIQRFGRLARGIHAHEGYWAVFATKEDLDRGSGVYLPRAVEGTWAVLNEIGVDSINWHLPRSLKPGLKGYMDLLDRVWEQYLRDILNNVSRIPSFYEALTSPIPSIDILQFIEKIGGLRDENICSAYVYEDESRIGGEDMWENAVPLPCSDMLEYAGKAIREGYKVYIFERDPRGGLYPRELSLSRIEEMAKRLRRDPLTFSLEIAGVAIPRELYEGGVYGSGLRDL